MMDLTPGQIAIVAGILVAGFSAVYSLATEGRSSTTVAGFLLAGGFTLAFLAFRYDGSELIEYSLIGVSVLAMVTSVVLLLART